MGQEKYIRKLFGYIKPCVCSKLKWNRKPFLTIWGCLWRCSDTIIPIIHSFKELLSKEWDRKNVEQTRELFRDTKVSNFFKQIKIWDSFLTSLDKIASAMCYLKKIQKDSKVEVLYRPGNSLQIWNIRFVLN